MSVLAIAAAVAAAGAVIGRGATSSVALSRHANPASPAAASIHAAAATRDQAAVWIATQAGPGTIVACDPAMCAALQASGVAAARLLVLGTAAADPLGSDIVVAQTPALRGQFGARLASVYTPAVIASFGSGAARIDVRAITLRRGGLRGGSHRGSRRPDRRGTPVAP